MSRNATIVCWLCGFVLIAGAACAWALGSGAPATKPAAASAAAPSTRPATTPSTCPATMSAAAIAQAARHAEADRKKADEARKKSYGGGEFAAEPAFEDDFLPGWDANQTAWDVATWKQNGTQMSPERCATDGHGYLVQTVLAGDPALGGSLESKGEFRYGRWVGRLKPAPVAGALNSFFTDDYDDRTTPDKLGDGTKFEIDIEFVTASFGPGKGQVELALHSAFGKKTPYGKIVDLGFNPSDDFHVYGFDILPDRITWYADGKVIGECKPPEGETVPDVAYEFFMNSWTAKKWVKGPPQADAPYHIDWVRFYPRVKK